MPNFKLTYWDAPGRAEPIRMLLSAAKVDFEDNRIQRTKEWPALKPLMPWNQIPILEVDGKILAESLAICRYLARVYNFVGSDEWESAKCDEYVDAISDLTPEMKKIAHEKDANKKELFKSKFLEESMPRCLMKFEDILKNSSDKSPFLIGFKLTWADAFVTTMLEKLEAPAYSGPNLLHKFPKLKQLKDAVHEYPGIKEWVEKRS